MQRETKRSRRGPATASIFNEYIAEVGYPLNRFSFNPIPTQTNILIPVRGSGVEVGVRYATLSQFARASDRAGKRFEKAHE